MSLHRFYLYRKSDIKALIALLLFVVVGTGIVWMIGNDTQEPTATADSTRAEAVGGTPRLRQGGAPQYYDQGASPEAERFAFDPNTADSTQLLRLGLAPYIVRGMYKYRAKGGVYRRAEDFARVPGLTQKQYRELKPYIRISADYLPSSILPEAQHLRRPHDSIYGPPKISETERIILNRADTAELKRVPGIGSYFARQIVGHGRRLGGYVSIEQLDEIDEFPTESKKYFVVDAAAVKRLNVNRLSVSQLKRHPYMGYYRAKAIDDYRRLHGPLHSLDELKLNRDFTPEAIRRLEPYVEF